MNNATPAVTVISDLIEAIEHTRVAEADARNASAARTACRHSSDIDAHFPAEALAAANEQWERAEADLNYNYDELAMALASARAYVAAA